jgi:hypothetical protein
MQTPDINDETCSSTTSIEAAQILPAIPTEMTLEVNSAKYEAYDLLKCER